VPLVVTIAFDHWVPFTIPGGRITQGVGGVVFLVGMALLGNAALGMMLRRTTLIPHHPVNHLVTNGMYRITRNPIYVGMVGVYLGVSLLALSWWPLPLLPPVAFAVRRLAIEPEEAYLRAVFGQEYLEYYQRVRRWL
jgi:protein-S-isoprenylcysteine O-methyltransferase Ste14